MLRVDGCGALQTLRGFGLSVGVGLRIGGPRTPCLEQTELAESPDSLHSTLQAPSAPASSSSATKAAAAATTRTTTTSTSAAATTTTTTTTYYDGDSLLTSTVPALFLWCSHAAVVERRLRGSEGAGICMHRKCGRHTLYPTAPKLRKCNPEEIQPKGLRSSHRYIIQNNEKITKKKSHENDNTDSSSHKVTATPTIVTIIVVVI